MLTETFERHTYESRLECSYLLQVPEKIDTDTLLLVTLHGYGSNPQDMLRLTTLVAGRAHVIASLQGPNQHFAAQPGPDAAAAYNWGIRQHWPSAITLHHEMLRKVLALLWSRFSLGSDRTVLAGFSQPVSLNYRFAGTHPGWVRGVIGLCGGVPGDWEQADYQPVDAALLHISREEDEFYAAGKARGFPDRLRRHASDVEFHMLPGGHRFPSKAGSIIQPWLNRVFGLPALSESFSPDLDSH